MADGLARSRLDPVEALRAMAGIVLNGESFEEVLRRAAVIAKQAIAGADEVSVTMNDGRPVTVASSGDLATSVDESQYAAGYGPCLEAIRLGQTIVVDDNTTEVRWPDYAPRAAEAGVRSSLSVPLPVDGRQVGAFNIYSRSPHAFGPDAIATGQDLSAYAGIVLNNAGLYFSATTEAAQLMEAMQSRAVIEQAKGILMGARRCDAEAAFDLLVRLSQESHRKLRDVAFALVSEAIAN